MEISKLNNNFEQSLKQKYNAVCFDIDGTLTEKNSRKISYKAIEMIADLLKRKVPVVFITGRGQQGLGHLKDDIYKPLKNDFNVCPEEFKRMYILTNDGARLFYTSENTKDDIFDENVYISTKEEIDALNKFNEEVIQKLDDDIMKDVVNIVYSVDLETDIVLNVRLVFNKEKEESLFKLHDKIVSIIEEKNLNSIAITRGVYEDKVVIQLGTAWKDMAIEKTEQIIGVPRDSMIRIGDCGDERGNDYGMLNCKQGYTVDRTCDTDDTCFPIFDETGNVLKGLDATLYLMKKAQILPTVCLESANKEDYTYNFAKVEKKIRKGRKEYLKRYNNIVNNNFDVLDGFNDLFDEYSGSIKIPMFEWEIEKDNPFKEFWSTCNNEKLLYSLRDDNNYLLRGASTYYYLLSNRKSQDGDDITTYEDVVSWYINYGEFFNKASEAVSSAKNINGIINKKFTLGILDNIRNVLMIIINHKLYDKYTEDNVIVNLDSKQEEVINKNYELLLNVLDNMQKICFDEDDSVRKKDILEIIKETITNLDEDYKTLKNNKKDYSKEFRTYREIDNFAENYITISLNNDKFKNDHNLSVCGMCYGGIELPILYKLLNKNIDEVLLFKFNSKVSGYSNKQLMDLRYFDIRKYGGICGASDLSNKPIMLLDDNVLTGKTLQLAINALYDYNLKVNNICVVRYPGINRVDQMFLSKHGAVDYHLFFDYITGLCFSSPYSWRDENKNIYEDSLGVFDLNRKKIIECLIKNHDYKENSEVGAYKRRLIKCVN